jgi:hypothetical protein
MIKINKFLLVQTAEERKNESKQEEEQGGKALRETIIFPRFDL